MGKVGASAPSLQRPTAAKKAARILALLKNLLPLATAYDRPLKPLAGSDGWLVRAIFESYENDVR